MSLAAVTREEILHRLGRAEEEIRALGVRRLALFGSAGRNELRSDSDVDLLVEFLPAEKTFDRFLRLSDLLEDLLGRRVELVTTEALSPFIGPPKRRMSFDPRDYLRHILAEVDYLIERSRDLDRDRFLADETLRRAFVRSLEIIGEAAKNIPGSWRKRHPHMDWRAMAAC